MINERTEFALRSLQPGINFSELCREYGISRRIGYKWQKRFAAEGAAGMADRSRKPHSNGQELGEDVICEIARLREAHKKWGPKKIRELYARQFGKAPSESTFKRIFEKAGWVEKRKRRRSTEAGRICSGLAAKEPNDVWTVDFKGWWHTRNGERCEPLTVRDEWSRYVLEVRSMATAKTEAVQAVFERLFEQYGLPKAIRSDNGPPFAARAAVLGLSRLSAWWAALGIDLERGRPGKPQDNGAHERMHRDIRNELQQCASEDLERQQAAFDIWRKTFNEERPHEALGMRTPAELYRPSPRPFTGAPSNLAYEGMDSRMVLATGEISLDCNRIPLTRALSGWSVGLKHREADLYDVYFANLRIGEINRATASFAGAAAPAKEVPSATKTL